VIKLKKTGVVLATQVEWMLTSWERAKGLLKYTSSPHDHAAIFKLPYLGFLPLIHTFKMNFTIDIVYCDKDGFILSFFKNVGPSRFIIPWGHLLGGASYVIEFAGCAPLEINIGDQISWEAA